jgi:hypothetical protein
MYTPRRFDDALPWAKALWRIVRRLVPTANLLGKNKLATAVLDKLKAILLKKGYVCSTLKEMRSAVKHNRNLVGALDFADGEADRLYFYKPVRDKTQARGIVASHFVIRSLDFWVVSFFDFILRCEELDGRVPVGKEPGVYDPEEDDPEEEDEEDEDMEVGSPPSLSHIFEDPGDGPRRAPPDDDDEDDGEDPEGEDEEDKGLSLPSSYIKNPGACEECVFMHLMPCPPKSKGMDMFFCTYNLTSSQRKSIRRVIDPFSKEARRWFKLQVRPRGTCRHFQS